MNNKAVIIYGMPGSGKGTQAELLAKKMGLIHFDTGWYLKNILYAEGAEQDPILKKEKELHNAGTLNTPSWVLEIVRGETEKIARAGRGVVYSGSPRTVYEVEGDKDNKGLINALEDEYGKENIHVFVLIIEHNEAVRRNKGRVICGVCKLPVLSSADAEQCSFCGGRTERRPDDKPELMDHRIEEYRTRTYPIIETLKKRGYSVEEIAGAPLPYEVHEEIMRRVR
jgi:adenylate kinase